MLGNVKEVVGDYVEVLVLLALVPIIISLWAGFASAVGTGGADPWVLVASNVTSYTIPDENGTYKVIARVSSGAVYYVIINTTGDWSAAVNGAPTSGSGYRASIIDTNATLGGGATSTGTYTAAAWVGYNAVPEVYVAIADVAGSQRVFYTISSGTATFDVYRYEPAQANTTPAGLLLNGLFAVLLLAVGIAIVAKVMRE